MFCHVLSCSVMFCHVLSCHVMFCHAMSYSVCFIVLSHVLSCHVMLYHLDAAGPVSVHGSVLVVETLQLELQVRPPHQGLVNLGTIVHSDGHNSDCDAHLRFEVKDVV